MDNKEFAKLETRAQQTTKTSHRPKGNIVPLEEVTFTEPETKEFASRSFSPIKTSTPARGYDEAEHQTQLLEDPIEVLQIQQVEEAKRKATMRQVKKQQPKEPALTMRRAPKSALRGTDFDENTEEPDELVNLSVKLAMLLVDNHRNNIKSYKSVKSAGINKIIDIVAAGCSEAEQMDINFLQR